ncbi:MAG: hypothetical protein HY314_03135 [Acidobacteria bacterium]|nr:hypothetical protein [Acidobacteriota bacterium]
MRTQHRAALILLGSVLIMSAQVEMLLALQGQTRPDPGFTAVSGPPFDAPDVWIDSPLNDYATYFGGTGSSGTPTGSGDPLWPGRIHRVYTRVHNFGNAPANNLTVNFYVRQPAGIGDGGAWELIGTLQRFGPIASGSFRLGFVQWTPATDAPASIKVVIDPLSGEATTTNNSVIESSSFFFDDGLGDPPELEFAVHNPSETSGVNLFFEAIVTPQGRSKETQDASDWRVVVDPESRYLRAGFDCTVRADVTPPNPCMVNDGH